MCITAPRVSLFSAFHFSRYLDDAAEPESSDRRIVFTVYDGIFNASSSILLAIKMIDDNPTTISVTGSGQYGYTEGNFPTGLSGLLLEDGDSGNSDVIVNSLTIEIINGVYNEIIDISLISSSITVSLNLPFNDLNCLLYKIFRSLLRDSNWF